MSVAERERPAVAWTPREQALFAVLREAQAAAEATGAENNDLRADNLVLRITLELVAGVAGTERARLERELPAVVPLITEVLDALARAEEIGHRTLAGVRHWPPRTPGGIAVPGFEPEAGDEQSIGGGADSSLAPRELAVSR